MKVWAIAIAVSLVGLMGCDKSKPELDKCKADLGKVQTELTTAKTEVDTAKKATADLQAKFDQLNKEREELLVKVTEFEAAAAAEAEQEAEKAAAPKPAAKKPAPAKEEPKTSTGATVPKVEQKYKGRFAK